MGGFGDFLVAPFNEQQVKASAYTFTNLQSALCSKHD